MSSPEPPPYTITSAILSLVAEIAGEVGRIGALSRAGQAPKLRRENRIRSVHASLAIENNTLSLDQVTAVLSGKRVLGPAREIREAGKKGTKSALSQHQVAILRQCRTETAIGELMAIAERRDRTKFRNQIRKPLLDAGWVEMTLPDKPNSRLQKFRLTKAVRSALSSSS